MGLTNFGSIVSNGQLLGSLGVGNVYHVVQTGQSYYSDFAAHRQGFYSDGSPILHTTIASALTATVADRNDYVIVYADTDDYDVGATTTLANASTHLINPAGMGAEYGCIRTATIDPAGAYHGVTITGRATELAGFWIRGYTEKYCIVSTGLGAFIHHNDCAVTCTTSAAGGIQVGAAGMQTRVERNFIFSNAGSGTWVFGISVSPSAVRTKV